MDRLSLSVYDENLGKEGIDSVDGLRVEDRFDGISLGDGLPARNSVACGENA